MIFLIQPTCGLCNRMRVLDSAIAYSRENKRPIFLIWLLNNELNCRLGDLFIIPDGVFDKILYVDCAKPIQSSLSKLLLKLPFWITGSYLSDNTKILKLLNQGQSFETIFRNNFSEKNFFYICTCYQFYSNSRPFFNLKPVASIQNLVDSYTRNHEYLIGVHIRRTDNKQAIQFSPTSKFIHVLQQEVDANSKVKFFVATDSLEVQQELENIFPGRIIIHNKSSLDRFSPAAIRDAVIDLYCLAQTRKLIGSYGNSFTETASKPGDVETVVVNTQAKDGVLTINRDKNKS